MAPSPFFQLRNYLAKKDVLDILRHFLGQRLPDAPDLLDKAVFLGLDLEWWEYPPHGPNGPITELGLAVFKGSDLAERAAPPDADFLEILKCIKIHHVRILENCHFRNTELAPQAEHQFLFGETRFLEEKKSKDLLISFLCAEGIVAAEDEATTPIILFGHGGQELESDKEHLVKHWKLEVRNVGNLVRTITTTPLAFQAGVRPENKGSLQDLIDGFGIARVGEKREDNRLWLHNAGNDIAYTTLVALLIGLFPRLYPDTTSGYPEVSDIQGKSMIKILAEFIEFAQEQDTPTWGIPHFCFRCESTNHDYSSTKCKVPIKKCGFCLSITGPENKKLRDKAKDHAYERCTVRYNLGKIKTIPLPPFIESSGKIDKKKKEEFKIAVLQWDEKKVGRIMMEVLKDLAPFRMVEEGELEEEEVLNELEVKEGELGNLKVHPVRVRRRSFGL